MTYLMYKGLPPKSTFKIMEDVRKGRGLKPEYEGRNEGPWRSQVVHRILQENKVYVPKAHWLRICSHGDKDLAGSRFIPAGFLYRVFYGACRRIRCNGHGRRQEESGENRWELEKQGNSISAKDRNVLTILEGRQWDVLQGGIAFLPVDLQSDAVSSLSRNNGIRRRRSNSLPGLGDNAAGLLRRPVRRGEFVSVDDLKIRAKVSRSVIEILQQSGCLDSIPESSQMSFF